METILYIALIILAVYLVRELLKHYVFGIIGFFMLMGIDNQDVNSTYTMVAVGCLLLQLWYYFEKNHRHEEKPKKKKRSFFNENAFEMSYYDRWLKEHHLK